jgi:hypothetical protein
VGETTDLLTALGITQFETLKERSARRAVEAEVERLRAEVEQLRKELLELRGAAQ